MRVSALFAIVAAIAAYFVAPNSTPIDRALPFVVVLLAICAAAAVEDELSGQTRLSVLQIAITLLLLPPIFFADEHTRLLAYGVIAAGAFAFAVAIAPSERYVILTLAGVLLLRWVPFSEVIIWRELIVLLGAVAVVLQSPTPIGVVSALAIAVVTPIFPARAMLFPVVVGALGTVRIPAAIAFLTAAFFTRYSIAILCVVGGVLCVVQAFSPARRRQDSLRHTELPVLHIPVYACAIALFAMWPWSGIVARAFPKFLVASPPPQGNQPVWVALQRGESVSIDAPPRKHAVGITASGANAARFPPETLMGTVDVIAKTGELTRREIRIGDIADFGFMRREHFFASRNPPPRNPINDVHGYGQSAWLHTAGWISLGSPEEIRSIRFFAPRDLPPGARLQIEAVDFE